MKLCGHCKVEKPDSEFHQWVHSPDGLHRWCKACRSETGRKYREAGRGKARTCKICGEEFVQKSTPTYCARCLVAVSMAADRARRARDPHAAHLRKKASHLKKYGLTLDSYGTMLKRQGGGCAICGVADSGGRKLSVDHCHTTGRVRGLLCNRCNYALGQFDDRPELLRIAADYLAGGLTESLSA